MVADLVRKKNSDYRSREHLTFDEVSRLIEAAELRGRHPVRDRCLLLLMFRHGLRASEAASLRWDAVMMAEREISITRCKGSQSGVHPLQADELEALQAVRAAYPGLYLFANERGDKLSTDAIAKIMTRAAELAELPIKAHPHMLRHSCGYYMANKGYDTRLIQEWLGHKNIQHTVRYTALSPNRFKVLEW